MLEMKILNSILKKEKDNKRPFLDFLIKNNNESDLKTFVFHKKSYTGLLLNYFFFCA